MKPTDLQNLKKRYATALAAVPDTDTSFYAPVYPQAVSGFMHSLCEPPWLEVNYERIEVWEVLEHVEQASLEQIRCLLTGFARAERFCDGAWLDIMQQPYWERIFARLEVLIQS